MRLVTWNVPGLRTKQNEVFNELEQNKIDLCVLTETKKKGKGSETVGNYIHFYSGVCKSTRAKRGVSIAVQKKYRNHIKSWEEIDEQIIIVELKLNSEQIVIIGVYAPSDDTDVTIKDQFYENLTGLLESFKNNKEVCLLGDFNARIGKKNNDLVVGRYGENRINDNGQRLIDVCKGSSLRIMNGFFPHKDIHKYTWIQPTKQLQSIIDYFIQRQTSRLKTTDVRVLRGAECGSDHHMILAKVVINFKKEKINNGKKVQK
ncbi:hypothetical protein RN001_010042 [Aquatica leii]|uniref:Endonuclease/exonuclease/phosphatase domain-containing protein n=1 Tax=Aquatica leii TaxID=1421715 RepID=A0AAN7P9F8_9COLE|nr:hypothetical protein RN001_010042 [Aquatica leii]